jgi:hypothetical protein
MQLPVHSKKGTVTIGVTAVNFSTPPLPPNDPTLTAYRQIAAESARKRYSREFADVVFKAFCFRANYKKSRAVEKNVGSVLGKDAGKLAKKMGIHKLF